MRRDRGCGRRRRRRCSEQRDRVADRSAQTIRRRRSRDRVAGSHRALRRHRRRLQPGALVFHLRPFDLPQPTTCASSWDTNAQSGSSSRIPFGDLKRESCCSTRSRRIPGSRERTAWTGSKACGSRIGPSVPSTGWNYLRLARSRLSRCRRGLERRRHVEREDRRPAVLFTSSSACLVRNGSGENG